MPVCSLWADGNAAKMCKVCAQCWILLEPGLGVITFSKWKQVGESLVKVSSLEFAGWVLISLWPLNTRYIKETLLHIIILPSLQ